MFRSIRSSDRLQARYLLIAVLVIGLALVATAFYLARQQFIPITGAVSAEKVSRDSQAASLPVAVNGGNVLVYGPDGAQVLGPEGMADSQPALIQTRPLSLGGGYTVVYGTEGTRRVIGPNGVMPSQPSMQSAPTHGLTIELSPEYLLVTEPDGTQRVVHK